MQQTGKSYFEGRDRSGHYVFAVCPPTGTDYYIHSVPPRFDDPRHVADDDCWCSPAISLERTNPDGTTVWRMAHNPKEDRASEGVRSEREDARQGGLDEGLAPPQRQPGAEVGEASASDSGEEDVAQGGGDWWDDGMFVT